METPATVDAWYAKQTDWSDEVAALRRIVLDAGLTEVLKWRQPCYTDQGTNILIVSHRKDAAVASFLRGALLDDPDGRLVQPGENSRSARYLPFTSLAQVHDDRAYLQGLIAQAIEVARAGSRVEKLPDAIEYVEELQQRLDADEAFRAAFEQLTPGRRRGYNLHFSQAKQSSTREARITRYTERIFKGKGLLDCICGHTKRPPGCDGSHKNFR